MQGAAALGHVAFIPANSLCYSAALDYLRAAEGQVAKHPDGRVASWLWAVESEIQANAGRHADSLTAVDRARESLASPSVIADLPWFDYYDSTRLSGFAGYALLRDGQFDASKAALTDAASHLPCQAVKQKAVFLADIATAEEAGGDLDQACASAGDAADSLRRAGYAVGLFATGRYSWPGGRVGPVQPRWECRTSW